MYFLDIWQNNENVLVAIIIDSGLKKILYYVFDAKFMY